MDCPTRTPAKSGHAGASHPSCSGRSGLVQRFKTLLNLLYAISNSHPQVPQPLFTSKTMCLIVWLCEISLCSDTVEQEQPRALIHGWYLNSSGVFFVTLGWLGVSIELGTCLSCRVRGTCVAATTTPNLLFVRVGNNCHVMPVTRLWQCTESTAPLASGYYPSTKQSRREPANEAH